MHYVRKEDFTGANVGDADALMREFFRAASVLNELDQNNIDNAGVTASRAISSKTSNQALTVGHDHSTGGAILLSQEIRGLSATPDPTDWSTSEDVVGLGLGFLTFELAATTRMRFYGRGDYSNTISTPATFDVRFLIDGSPGKHIFSGSMTDGGLGTVRIGWSLQEERILFPGVHQLGLQVRDRSDSSAASAGTFRDQAFGTNAAGFVYALGFVR